MQGGSTRASGQSGRVSAAPTDTVMQAMRSLAERWSRSDPFDLATALLIAAIALIAFATVSDFSISNDEAVQQHYGELIIAYYRSGLVDQAVFHYENLYLYGGLFDIIAVFLQHLVPLEPYLVRHILCAAIGIAGIVATWATARTLAGPRAGLIAVALIAVTGPYFGGMFNHTKDIPFAAAMMGATYFLVRVGRALPRPALEDVLWFGVMIGCALGLRSLALLLIGYTGIAVLLRIPRPFDLSGAARFVWRSGIAFLPAFAVGYLIMIAVWPWAALAPLNPLRGLLEFDHFHYKIATFLAGTVYDMATVPRWYEPVYMAIKLPIPLLFGGVLALLALAWPRLIASDNRPVDRREFGLLAFVALFPLICEVAAHGPAFTGMRHFLFLVPPLAVLAGVGWDRTIAALTERMPAMGWSVATAVGTGVVWIAITLMRLHPYEYVYYNAFVGGLPGAANAYDTDYWVNSMDEAVRDLEAYLDRTDPHWRTHHPIQVAVCGEKLPFDKVAAPTLRFQPDWDRADYFISPTHMGCDHELPGKVVAKVERLGVPIALVKDHRSLKRTGVAQSR